MPKTFAQTRSSSGGAASDYLSVLTSAEISVTGATTATISRQHVCSGTSADYTLTLPAASGNTGKFLGIRMDPALTKLVTIDGNASEKINNALTRVMWANESCVLYCDGSNWFKIPGGLSIPMQCLVRLSTATQTINNGVLTKIAINTTDIDNTGLMADTANNRIVIRRANNYVLSGNVQYQAASTVTLFESTLEVNQSIVHGAFGSAATTPANNFVNMTATKLHACAVSDQVELFGFQNVNGGGNLNAIGGAITVAPSQLNVMEVVSW